MHQTAEALCRKLNYQFTDQSLLEHALTHRSVSQRNNERLEYLGDAILSLVIAEELYKQYPDASEGELSRSRASLVNKDSLAKLANILELGEYLHLGVGELKSGGHRRDSILADAFEAILGAVYLDSNFDQVKQLILQQYQVLLNNMPDAESLKDPKTRLQEKLQSMQYPVPVYELLDMKGKPHNQTFLIECSIEALEQKTQGTGSSRRKAEQVAAEKMLSILQA